MTKKAAYVMAFIIANIAAYIGQTYLYQSELWQSVFITIPVHILSLIYFLPKMKNLLFSMLAIAAISTTSLFQSCTGCNRPEPNYEGVLMENCGKNGLADFRVVTGSQGVLGPCSELYQIPMFEQKADPDELGVTSKDGGYFSVNPLYTYEAQRGKGPEVCFNYKHVNPSSGDFMDNVETNVLNPLVLNAYREEARNFSTDSLLNNMAAFELAVEGRLKKEFSGKFFNILSLTSGLKPPASMIQAIENKNNTKQYAEQKRNELEVAQMDLQKARIEAEANRVRSQGLSKEILQQQMIDAIKWSNNRIIITDGKTPVIIGQ